MEAERLCGESRELAVSLVGAPANGVPTTAHLCRAVMAYVLGAVGSSLSLPHSAGKSCDPRGITAYTSLGLFESPTFTEWQRVTQGHLRRFVFPVPVLYSLPSG